MTKVEAPGGKGQPKRARSVWWLACALATIAILVCCFLGLHHRGALRVWRVRQSQKATWQAFAAEGLAPEGVHREGGRILRARDGAEMCVIPEGHFPMGDTENRDEGPVRRIYLSPYLIDKFEVTNRQFKQFISASPRWTPSAVSAPTYLPYWQNDRCPPQQDRHPVHHVTWEAARAYAHWAGATLPTEAQWEKAARGGLQAKQYPWGDAPDPTKANWGRPRWPHCEPGRPNEPESFEGAKFSNPGTTPVGSFPPNGYGLHDVAGNVWEWCADWYSPRYYDVVPGHNPGETAQIAVFEVLGWGKFVSARSARGGSWYRRPAMCRCANRSYDHFAAPLTHLTEYYYGFRCVVNFPGGE